MPSDLVGLLLELKSLPLFMLAKKAFHSSFETDGKKCLFYIRRSHFTSFDRIKFKPVADCNRMWLRVAGIFLPCGTRGRIPKAEALPSLCQWGSRLMLRGHLWLLSLLA